MFDFLAQSRFTKPFAYIAPKPVPVYNKPKRVVAKNTLLPTIVIFEKDGKIPRKSMLV